MRQIRYGGPAPIVNGSIVIDLHRMNKVLEVNDKFAYAVVEPGVTFGDLYAYCAERKLKVWPSTASLGWGSVLGNVSLTDLCYRVENVGNLTRPHLSRRWIEVWGSYRPEFTTSTSLASK